MPHEAVHPPEQLHGEGVDDLRKYRRAEGEQALGMAPTRDDPEVLRLAGLVVEVLCLLGGEEGIRAAVDDQDGGRRDLADNLDRAVSIRHLPRETDPRPRPGGGQTARAAPDK